MIITLLIGVAVGLIMGLAFGFYKYSEIIELADSERERRKYLEKQSVENSRKYQFKEDLRRTLGGNEHSNLDQLIAEAAKRGAEDINARVKMAGLADFCDVVRYSVPAKPKRRRGK